MRTKLNVECWRQLLTIDWTARALYNKKRWRLELYNDYAYKIFEAPGAKWGYKIYWQGEFGNQMVYPR